MSEKHFYNSLKQYFMQNNLDAMVYHDTFTQEQYGAFGKETIGIPRLFIDRDKSIGNIDVYGVEFYDPIGQEIYKEFQHYVEHLKLFLEKYHIEKGNHYIIYRRNKSLGNHFLRGLEADLVYSYFAQDHYQVTSETILFKYLNKSSLHWCLYSNTEVKRAFEKISIVVDAIENAKNKELIEIGDLKIINSDFISNGFRFRLNEDNYVINFPEGKTLECELKMMKYPNSAPLCFDATNEINIKDKIDELKLINRLFLLLQF